MSATTTGQASPPKTGPTSPTGPTGTATASRAAGGRRRGQPLLLSRAVVNTLLVLSAAYMLFPLLWLLSTASKSLENLYATSLFDLSNLQLAENVSTLLAESDGIFARWYLNSLVYAGVGAAVGALVCVAAGYAFDKLAFRGKEGWFGLVLMGVLVPTTALALPLYLMASRLGVVDTTWAVLIPVLTNPFGVYLARVFSRGYVPDEVLEAARVDGAGELRSFYSVGLRLLAPGYVTILLFQFVAIWNNFLLPLVMLSDSTKFPVSLGLYVWNSQATADPRFYSLVITGSFVAVVPLVVAFVALQRFWKSGLSAGSVK
jgi:multiple sugar transport system permease protein